MALASPERQIQDLRAELADEGWPTPVEGVGPQAELDAWARDGELVDAAARSVEARGRWLESAADLLREPDPGETPFVIRDLIVEASIAVIQGPPKVGKTFFVLEEALAIVTGKPVLDRFHVPIQGPVMLVCEESGRAALHRRLRDLCRAKGLEHDALADLRFAANRRVRLDDRDWQARLTDAAAKLRPRAILLDPLVRMKGAGVDESSQKEMGVVLEFMRDLRDATGAAVQFVHHTGHEAARLRGTSDLEALWESKVTITRADGDLELSSEHREAEPGPTVRYRLQEVGEGLRLVELEREPLAELVAERLERHPGSTIEEVATGIHRRRQDVASELRDGRDSGSYEQRPRELDGSGRVSRGRGWFNRPDAGTLLDARPSGAPGGNRPGVTPLPIGEGSTGRAAAAGEDEPL